MTIDGIDLAEMRQHIAAQQNLRLSMVPLEENLKREENRLESLEECLHHVAAELERMESGGLGTMLSSLLGQKEKNLTAKRHELKKFQRQQTECSDSLESMAQEFLSIQQQLVDPQELEQEFQRLFTDRRDFLVARGGETAERLSNAREQLNMAKSWRNKLGSAVALGKHLQERLHSMTRTVGRARTRGVNPGAGGALFTTAANMVLRDGSAKSSVGRVRQGLEELAQTIGDLDLDPSDRRGEALIGLHTGIMTFAAEVASSGASGMVWDSSSISPMVEATHQATAHLQDLHEEANATVEAWEKEEQAIVEGE